jgi:Ca-activated chloride channel family protein
MMLQRFTRTGNAWIVPLFLCGPLVYAQFTSGVSLVEVYATVTDARGEPVTDLKASDFQVRQDGALQTITTFAAGEFPLAVAVGLDRSFSMAGRTGSRTDRLAAAKSAARAFLGALRKDDQVMIVAIGSDTDVVAPLSTNHAATLAAIDRLDAWGTTPLYDATLAALDAVQSAKGRRALVLLSDGTDRYSDTTATELLEQARRRDVLVYPIAMGSARPPVFAELATATGGRSFFVKDPRELAGILTTIARELRVQYLLGYVPAASPSTTPSTSGDSTWHAIDVEVDRPGVRVRARDGYFAR